MAGEEQRQDLDISTGKGTGGAPTGEKPKEGDSSQTQGSGAPEGGESTKPEGSEGEGTGAEEGTPTGQDGAEGQGQDEINPDTGKPFTAAEWRDKFRNSAKGANELLEKTKDLETKLGEKDGRVTELEKKVQELTQISEGKNPEGLKAHELQDQLKQTTEALATLKENQELDSFEKANPLAASKREALRTLARANPKESLQKLWDDNLKAGAEAEDAKRTKKQETQKKGAGEKGKGTSTTEPAGEGDTVKGNKGDTGLSLEEFNKLPVGERRQLMEKYDIR